MDSFFPKKKGLALGWASMGINLSAAGAVPLLSLLLSVFGLTKAFTLIGAALLACGVVCVVTIRNAPEELGLSPDNEPLTEDQIEESKRKLDDYRSQWRMVDFLKVRETWCVGIAFGIQYLCAIGILSQFIPRTVSLGYEQSEAILMMSVSALVGLFGSYFWGWLDMKIGIRKASITIMCWYTAATALFVVPYSKPVLILGVAMVCFALGGTASLAASYTGTVFGRHEFGRVFGLVNPITAAVRVSAWALLSFGLSKFGDYTPVYTIFLFCAIGGIALICCAKDSFRASPGSVGSESFRDTP
jgi:sugar phosphate permease